MPFIAFAAVIGGILGVALSPFGWLASIFLMGPAAGCLLALVAALVISEARRVDGGLGGGDSTDSQNRLRRGRFDQSEPKDGESLYYGEPRVL